MRQDLVRALLVWAGWIVLSLGSYFAFSALFPADPAVPESETRIISLLIVTVTSVVVAAGVAALRWWREIGYAPPREWRQTHWFWVFALITLIPLAAGIRPHDPAEYAVFAAGFLLTGFAEETVFRGVLVKLLDNRSPIMIATIAAVLFGLVHLSNIVIRGQTVVIVAQAIGAMADGFGFVALRLRTRTLVPLIFIHAVHDLFLWMGNLPVIPVAVVQDTIFLAIGVYLLWGWRPADGPGSAAVRR